MVNNTQFINRSNGVCAISVMEDILTPDECSSIIRLAEINDPVRLGTVNNDFESRKVSSRLFNDYSKITSKKIMEKIDFFNLDCFRFDIRGIPDFDPINILEYQSVTADKYDWHMDVGPEQFSTRKLSFSLQLTDGNLYEGGNLKFCPDMVPKYDQRKIGSLIVFPSYMAHCVTPVTKGVRWALVGWVHGPSFV